MVYQSISHCSAQNNTIIYFHIHTNAKFSIHIKRTLAICINVVSLSCWYKSTPCSRYTLYAISSQDHTVFLLQTLLNLVVYGTQHILALDDQPKLKTLRSFVHQKYWYMSIEKVLRYHFHSDPTPIQNLHHLRMSQFHYYLHQCCYLCHSQWKNQ